MSGILNTKQRIMDTILTQEGKRQLASGELRLNFVTFTDNATFYKKDLVSGSADASQRIYLEACNLPQDQITFESHDTGQLMNFIGSDENGFKILNGKLISGSTYITSSISSVSNDLLDSSLLAFKRLQSIGSKDMFFDDNTFELSENEISFDITDKTPFKKGDVEFNANIAIAENLFSDSRLARTPNYKYLPPVNRQSMNYLDSDIIDLQPLSDYPKVNTVSEEDNINIIREKLFNMESIGYKKTINFIETSRQNNIFCQFFETSNSYINKLDIIDFGIIEEKKYYFIGKIFNYNGEAKFINLFTLVFEN